MRNLLALFFAVVLSTDASARAPSTTEVFAPDSERLMEALLIDGIPVSEALVVYPYDNTWLLPLGALSDALGFSIQVWDRKLSAEGFFIDESRRFFLDAANCVVRSDGKKFSYPCEGVLANEGDLYVRAELLSQWFPFDTTVESFRSRMYITPREPLPVQARFEREWSAQRARTAAQGADLGYDTVHTPYRMLRLTSLDQQLSLTKYSSGGDVPWLGATSQLSGQLSGMDMYLYAAGTNQGVNAFRPMLSRTVSEGTFGGPLRATQLQLLGVDLPTMPLLAQAQPAFGIVVSSYPVNQPNNFETADIQGPIAAGWEVLLLRNEVLLDRRTPDETGFYRFKGVGLLYGQNLFRLTFFGPQGQRRDEYRTYVIDPTQLKKGQTNYRVSASNLPRENQATTFQVASYLGSGMTGQGAAYIERDPNFRLASLGVVGVNDYLLYSARTAFSSTGGTAIEVGPTFGIGRASLGVRHTWLLGNYRSRLFNFDLGSDLQRTFTEGTLNYVLPIASGIGLSMELFRRTFDVAPPDELLRSRMSMYLLGVQFQQELDYAPKSLVPFVARSQALYFGGSMQFRVSGEYTTKEFRASEFEVRYQQFDQFSLLANARVPFYDAPVTTRLEASRLFRPLSVGLFGSTTPNGKEWSAGVQLQTSLVRDDRDGATYMYRQAQGQMGSASVFAFIDANGNGVADDGEKGVPNVYVRVNRREKYKTDSRGIVLIPSLRAYQEQILEFSDEDSQNVFLQPAKPGYRLIPRSGNVTSVDIPFQLLGQIDGYVSAVEAAGDRPKTRSRAVLELFDGDGNVVATTKSDSDGFYAFERVPAGRSYQVRMQATWLTEQGYVATPLQHPAVLAPEGSFVSGLDFTLTVPRSAKTARNRPLSRPGARRRLPASRQ